MGTGKCRKNKASGVYYQAQDFFASPDDYEAYEEDAGLDAVALPGAAGAVFETDIGKTDYQEVADRVNQYCDEVNALEIEDSMQEAYQKYYREVAVCVIKFRQAAETIEELWQEFMSTSKSSFGAPKDELNVKNAAAIFLNWTVSGLYDSCWNDPSTCSPDEVPADVGYFFKTYSGDSDRNRNYKDIINFYMLNLSAHIQWLGHLGVHQGRVMEGVDAAPPSSAAFAEIVDRAHYLYTRYMYGWSTSGTRPGSSRSTAGWEGVFSGYLYGLDKTATGYTDLSGDPREPTSAEIQGTNPDSNEGLLGWWAYGVSNGKTWYHKPEFYASTPVYTGASALYDASGDPYLEPITKAGTGKQENSPTNSLFKYAQQYTAFVSGKEDISSDIVKIPQNYTYTTSTQATTYGGNQLTTQLYKKLNIAIQELARADTSLDRYLTSMMNMISQLPSLTQGIYENLHCIMKAAEEFAKVAPDLQNDLKKLRETLADDLDDLQAAGGEHPWVRVVPIVDSVEDLYGDMRSLGSLEEEEYARHPEKLFFKEQCYLLTYIPEISQYKKDTLDRTVGGSSNKRLPYANLTKKETYKGTPNEDYMHYGNATLLLNGDPYGFLNKLAISKNLKPLLNIESHILSQLQPHIRLYKVEFNDDGKERDIEVSFEPAFTSFEKDLFSSDAVRNTGVGLKNFTFTYDGSNPFGAKKSIKAQLKIFSNSFDELMISRRNSRRQQYRYVDLALKTFSTGQPKYKQIIRENEELSKLNFRLKAQVGYSIPSSLKDTMATADLESLLGAINDSIVNLNLTPTVHDFKFDELGRVEFTINYLAYVEDLYSQAKFNVFSEAKFASRRVIRNLKTEHYTKECEPEAVNEIKKNYSKIAQREISDSISNLITLMMDRNKIYYMAISTEQIKSFVSYGPFAAAFRSTSGAPQILVDEDYLASLQDSIDQSLHVYRSKSGDPDFLNSNDRKTGAVSASLASMDPKRNILSFFYVSDLIDILLENIETEITEMPQNLREAVENDAASSTVIDPDLVTEKIKEYEKYEKIFKKLRFLLGPVEFSNHANTAESMFVNLGDIPISVKYFFEWITSTMLDRDDSFYSLTRFMNEFFNGLVNKFLNNDNCFDYSVRQRTRLNQATLLGPAQASTDEIIDPITHIFATNKKARMNISDAKIKEKLPLIKSYGGVNNSARNDIDSDEEINYMIYFVGRTLPSESMRGNKSADEKKGIFHYQIGRDRGLVKDIQLTKTQTPGLQEVRFEQEGYDGLEQLRVVYDAKIKSYSNVNTFPGTYIYIDPKGYAPHTSLDLTKYGVGGYYMIIRSTHTFAPGAASSDIEAKWVNKIYDANDEVRDIFVKEETGTGDSANQKCAGPRERSSRASD